MSKLQLYRNDPEFLALEAKLASAYVEMDALWSELRAKFPLDDHSDYMIMGNNRLSQYYVRSPDEQ